MMGVDIGDWPTTAEAKLPVMLHYRIAKLFVFQVNGECKSGIGTLCRQDFLQSFVKSFWRHRLAILQ